MWCLLCPNVLRELVLKLSLGVTVVTQCVYPSRPTVQSHLTQLAMGAYDLHSSKQPVCMACLTLFSSSSAANASSTVLVVSALGVAFTATNLTYSSASCLSVVPFFHRRDAKTGLLCFACRECKQHESHKVVVLAPTSRCERMVLIAGHRSFSAVIRD